MKKCLQAKPKQKKAKGETVAFSLIKFTTINRTAAVEKLLISFFLSLKCVNNCSCSHISNFPCQPVEGLSTTVFVKADPKIKNRSGPCSAVYWSIHQAFNLYLICSPLSAAVPELSPPMGCFFLRANNDDDHHHHHGDNDNRLWNPIQVGLWYAFVACSSLELCVDKSHC